MFSRSLLIVLTLAVPTSASENWPGWRGPTGMGTSDEKGLPLTWGGNSQENVRWKVPLFPSEKVRRDQNQSSPIVWGDRVYVTISYWPEGVSEKSHPEHHILCFRAGDGARLWDAKIEPGPWKLTDLRGGYTAPTPATDGDRVYALFGSAVLAAVDGKGSLVWRKEITPHFFDVALAASPVLFRDTVLVMCDQLRDRKASCLLAFDTRSGDIRWKKDRPSVDWAHSTPALTEIGGRPQLLVATANGPQGLDPTNGEVLWEYRSPQRIGDTVTPVAQGRLLYVDSGRGGPGIAVDPTGSGDVTATHLRWKTSVVPSGFSSPVVTRDYLYRLFGNGVISCRKWTTGDEVFKERLEGFDSAISPITTADDRIYCASAGKSYVLHAGPKLEILGRGDLGDASRASAAVAGGRLYLKGALYLHCIGHR